MTNHKFITVDTDETFDGERFITSTSSHCLNCGGLWYAFDYNYENEIVLEESVLVSATGEQPTTCSPEHDRVHRYQGDISPSLRYENCNCWACDS